MKKNLFREKNLKKAADPEQLDTYLKVTGFGPWFVVIAAFLVILAIVIWGVAGNIRTIINGAGYCSDGKLRCYFSTNDIPYISIGDQGEVAATFCTVTDVDSALYLSYDIPNDVLYLLPEAEWYSTADMTADLEDGLYTVQFVIKETPVSFLTERE